MIEPLGDTIHENVLSKLIAQGSQGITKHNYYLIEAEWRIHALVNQPSLVQIRAWCLVGAKPL